MSTVVYTTNLSTLTESIADKLQKINNTFLQENLSTSPFLQSFPTANDTTKELRILFDGNLGTFKTEYGGLTNTNVTLVDYRSATSATNSTYTALGSTVGLNIALDSSSNLREFNFARYLNTVNNPGATNLLNNLNTYRVLYNFLDTNKYSDYLRLSTVPTNTFTLRKYDRAARDYVAAVSADTQMVSRKTVNTDMYTLFKLSPMPATTESPLIDQQLTNQIVLRRMLLLLEVMTNFKIALAMFDALGDNADGTTPEKGQNQLRLVQATLDVLSYLNQKSSAYTSSRVAADAVSRYNSLNTSLQDVDTSLKDSKTDLATKQMSQEVELNKKRRASKIFYVVSFFTLILLLAAMVLVALPDLENSVRVIGVSAILVLFVVMALVVRYVMGKTYEYFGVGDVITGGSGNLILPMTLPNVIQNLQLGHNDLVNMYTGMALREAQTFLDDTINFGYDMSSIQLYDTINYSMQKEYNYFQGLDDKVRISSKKVKDYNVVVVLSAITHVSNIRFILSIAVTLVLIAILVLATPGMASLHTTLYWIAAVVVFFIALFYFMSVLRRVRTDARQFYWSKPSLPME